MNTITHTTIFNESRKIASSMFPRLSFKQRRTVCIADADGVDELMQECIQTFLEMQAERAAITRDDLYKKVLHKINYKVVENSSVPPLISMYREDDTTIDVVGDDDLDMLSEQKDTDIDQHIMGCSKLSGYEKLLLLHEQKHGHDDDFVKEFGYRDARAIRAQRDKLRQKLSDMLPV